MNIGRGIAADLWTSLMKGKRVLYIAGFNNRTTARELADEFERYGRVNRVEIPPAGGRGDRFAFLEYDHPDDAHEAYRKMHEKRLRCGVIRVEWAKRLPRAFTDDRGDRGDRRRSRSRSPARSASPRGRSRSPARGNSRSRSASRSGSRSMNISRSRSPLADGGRNSGSRSPSPIRSPGVAH